MAKSTIISESLASGFDLSLRERTGLALGKRHRANRGGGAESGAGQQKSFVTHIHPH
jgi:hypothetical protein